MRTELASIVLGIVLAGQFAYSADVAYQLGVENPKANESTKLEELGKFAIVNREWAAPGVEQSEAEISPGREFNFAKRARIHFEFVERGGSVIVPGPHWLDDVAWPRTRAWFQRFDSRLTDSGLSSYFSDESIEYVH
jgi:hypothetical protein